MLNSLDVLDANTEHAKANRWLITEVPAEVLPLHEKLEACREELRSLRVVLRRNKAFTHDEEQAYTRVVSAIGDLSNQIRQTHTRIWNEQQQDQKRTASQKLQADNERLQAECDNLQKTAKVDAVRINLQDSVIDRQHWKIAKLNLYLFIVSGLFVLALIFSALLVYNFI